MRTGKRFVHGLVIGLSMFICLAGALATPSDSQAAYSILYSFAGGTGDGFQPFGSLTLAGSTLYGLTYGGPHPPSPQPSYSGTIFEINLDGSGYQILHPFGGPDAKDGTIPKGSLTLSGETLYGFTPYGGGPNNSNVGGSVFKINTNGTGYQNLHGWSGNPPPDAHRHPIGTPVVSGSTIYGMTTDEQAGEGNGSIFKINTDVTGYQLLYAFGGAPSDGALPQGSLTLVGSKLYGMTSKGGSFGSTVGGYGVIFSLNLDTSEYLVLHNFAGAPNDGINPAGALTLVGSKLYGMTAAGGKNNTSGVLFSINLDDGVYQVLFDFSTVNVSGPHGSLTHSGSKLYGMTAYGGGGGAVFQINTDGTGFRLLHHFNSFAGDGTYPYGDVTVVGSRLYGMTNGGGSSGDGVIFSCQIPQDTGMLLLLLLQ